MMLRSIKGTDRVLSADAAFVYSTFTSLPVEYSYVFCLLIVSAFLDTIQHFARGVHG